MKQKGCNGLTYTLDYTKEKGKFDEEVTQDGELPFVIIFYFSEGFNDTRACCSCAITAVSFLLFVLFIN